MIALKNISKWTWCYIAIAMLIGVGLAVFPMFGDDIYFSMPFKDYLLGHKEFEWNVLSEALRASYFEDNSRLCILFTTILMALPRWITALGTTISLIFTMKVGASIAEIKGSWILNSLLILVIVAFIPWLDQFYEIAFQLNYIWALGLALTTSLLFIEHKPGGIISAICLSIILGAWQEGFSVPMLASFLTLLVFIKQYRQTKTIALTLGLFIGVCILMLSPKLNTIPKRVYVERMIYIWTYLIPNIIAMVLTLWVWLKKRHLFNQIRDKIILLGIPVLASAAITLYSCQGMRVNTIGIVYSCLIILLILSKLVVKKFHVAAIIILGAIVFHLTAVDIECFKTRADYNSVVSSYIDNPKKTIFSKMMLREEIPWYNLMKPYYGQFTNTWSLCGYEHFYGDGTIQMKVAPERLRGFTPTEAEVLDRLSNAYYYKGQIVLKGKIDGRGWGSFLVDYGLGLKERRFIVIPFTSEKDGQDYLWLYLERINLDQIFHPHPTQFKDF